MNVIDIVLVVAAMLLILHGYLKGFLVAILSLARYLLGIPLCYFVAKSCSAPLYYALIQDIVGAQIARGVESTGIDNIVTGVKNTVSEFPEALQNVIDLSFLNNISAANATQGIMQNVVDPVVIVILKIVIFVAVSAVFLILTSILIAAIDKASKKKDAPFKDTNKFLGAALGAVKAFIILIAVAAIGNFLVTYLGGAGSFIDQIDSSAVIGFINKFNPLLMI